MYVCVCVCVLVVAEDTLGLSEELQSTGNYSLGLNKILVSTVKAMVRATRRMLSVGRTGQQLIGVLG